MPTATIVIGVLLTLLGPIGYFASGAASLTAFIPTAFGVALLLLGLLARNARMRKYMMHVAILVALLGLIGSVRGITGLVTLLGGGEVPRPAAAVSQSVMALLCLILIGLGIHSFLAARRNRTPQTGPSA